MDPVKCHLVKQWVVLCQLSNHLTLNLMLATPTNLTLATHTNLVVVMSTHSTVGLLWQDQVTQVTRGRPDLYFVLELARASKEAARAA